MKHLKQRIIGGLIVVIGICIACFTIQQTNIIQTVFAVQEGGAGKNNLDNGIITINKMGDFPAPVAGVITLENAAYRLNNNLVTSDRFFIPDGVIVHFMARNALLGGITYTGTGAMFTGDDISSLDLFVGNYSYPNGTLLDITPDSSSFGTVFIEFVVLFDGQSIGTVKNMDTFQTINSGIFDMGQGIVLENVRSISVPINQWSGWKDEGGTFITLKGTSEDVLISDNAFKPEATESVIRIDPTFSVNGGIVTGVSFVDLEGGEFFETGLTGSITAFADAGGGFTTVTSATHGLSNGDTLLISGTTNYDGGFAVSASTTNTFAIEIAFVADDATGSFDSGSKDQNDLDWVFSANANVPATATTDRQFVSNQIPQNTSSGTFVDVTGATLTTKNLRQDGNYLILLPVSVSASVANTTAQFRILVNGSPISGMPRNLVLKTSNTDVGFTFAVFTDGITDGDVFQVQWLTDKGTLTLNEFDFLMDGIAEELVVQ